MTAETDLLPSSVAAFTEALKGARGSLDAWLEVNDEREVAAHVEAYARANVAHATAPLQAEVEALRAEVDALREALEGIRSRSTMNLAMQPDLFALAAKLGYIHQVADAAIDRARTSGADDEA